MSELPSLLELSGRSPSSDPTKRKDSESLLGTNAIFFRSSKKLVSYWHMDDRK